MIDWLAAALLLAMVAKLSIACGRFPMQVILKILFITSCEMQFKNYTVHANTHLIAMML
jgi:hypothetical protein